MAIKNKNLMMTDTGTANAKTASVSMGGNVSHPTTVFSTSAAQRSANANKAINASKNNIGNVSHPTTVFSTSAAQRSANANKAINASKNNIGNQLNNAINQISDAINAYEVSGFGGGGGASVSDLIGNVAVDPTAEIRSRYAGILSDLANNNQYVLDKLKGNYDTSVNTINADYDTSISRQNADAEDALRQAYINYMMSRKNMDSALARQGYTGGLSESNQARMFNNYGNIRNDIRKTLNNAIENYNLKRNAALGEALNQYNAQLADQASDYFNKKQNYETTLSNALANLMR